MLVALRAAAVPATREDASIEAFSQAPAAGRPAPTASSAGYRSHRRRRQAPIVGTGPGPTPRPHAPSNRPGAPRRYATRATAPSSPHPPAACRQDRPRMQRLPTTAPSSRPIRTQSTPSDTFLVNPPSTARLADLRQNDRQRPLAPSADTRRRAGRRTQPDNSPHAPSRPRAEQDLQSSRTSSPSRRAVRCPS